MTAKTKRHIFILLIGIGFLLAGILINFIPTWNLKTTDMNVLYGDWINVYYETEEAAARDVFTYANTETAFLAEN